MQLEQHAITLLSHSPNLVHLAVASDEFDCSLAYLMERRTYDASVRFWSLSLS